MPTVLLRNCYLRALLCACLRLDNPCENVHIAGPDAAIKCSPDLIKLQLGAKVLNHIKGLPFIHAIIGSIPGTQHVDGEALNMAVKQRFLAGSSTKHTTLVCHKFS